MLSNMSLKQSTVRGNTYIGYSDHVRYNISNAVGEKTKHQTTPALSSTQTMGRQNRTPMRADIYNILATGSRQEVHKSYAQGWATTPMTFHAAREK